VADARPTEIDGSRVLAVNETDGKKFALDDGSWLLIRFSGTGAAPPHLYGDDELERVKRIIGAGRDIAGV
jgi:hypothetical protein